MCLGRFVLSEMIEFVVHLGKMSLPVNCERVCERELFLYDRNASDQVYHI